MGDITQHQHRSYVLPLTSPLLSYLSSSQLGVYIYIIQDTRYKIEDTVIPRLTTVFSLAY